MGQKVNPNGIRLGINRTWSSRWFSKSEYTKLLHQDIKIKNYVESKLKNASISKINIERAAKKLRLSIFSSRPGTPAANLKIVNSKIAKERLDLFQKTANDIKTRYRKELINSKIKVLFENKIKNKDEYFGRDEHFNSVIVKSRDDLTGKIMNIETHIALSACFNFFSPISPFEA